MSNEIKFQFTPLREGRRVGAARVLVWLKFQFTPLREGRQQNVTNPHAFLCNFCGKHKQCNTTREKEQWLFCQNPLRILRQYAKFCCADLPAQSVREAPAQNS